MEMRRRGYEHARQLSWKMTAQQTAQAYHSALGIPGPVPHPALASS
jgi:hypothetical protein